MQWYLAVYKISCKNYNFLQDGFKVSARLAQNFLQDYSYTISCKKFLISCKMASKVLARLAQNFLQD